MNSNLKALFFAVAIILFLIEAFNLVKSGVKVGWIGLACLAAPFFGDAFSDT